MLKPIVTILVVIVILYIVFRNTRLMENYLGYDIAPAPVGYHTGEGVPYSTSGYKLKYNPTEWDYLYNTPAAKNRQFVTVQGTPTPLAYEEKPANLPDDSMFIFQKNLASPLCCPSTYSTSRGCVCTPSWQRWQIGYVRGGNNSPPGAYPFI